MTYLVYDGSFDGFLTAIFYTYDYKLDTVAIRKNTVEIPQLFVEQTAVITDTEKAARVSKSLINIVGQKFFNELLKVLLSELDTIEDAVLNVIRALFQTKKNILNNFGNPDVLEIKQVLKKLSRERHRMNAFVRFKLAKDGIYYAFIEPDFDVLPLISNHFKSRYADQQWLIYDLKRNKGLFYNLEDVALVTLNNQENISSTITEVDLNADEVAFQTLWQTYFKHTNIPSRKNMKLHLQHVPKRYWKYLTEKES